MRPEIDPAASRPGTCPRSAGESAHRQRVRLIRGGSLALLLALGVGPGGQLPSRSADDAAPESTETRCRLVMPAPRGTIYDREHRILATTRTRLAAVLDLDRARPELAGRENARGGDEFARALVDVAQHQLDRINAVTGRSSAVDALELKRAFADHRVVPFVLADDLNAGEVRAITAMLRPNDPVQITPRYQRWYPYGSAAAHVLGRVHREPETRTPAAARDGPRPIGFPLVSGDSGIEKQYDARLQGRPANAILRVDPPGIPVGPAEDCQDAVAGGDVILSLDLDLQRAAGRAMAATRGGAVAIEVATGEILAMASTPDFDLNAVSPVIAPALKQRIDAEGGWLNRATQGLYPPGSTFKVFTVLAGLRSGTLHPDDVFHCDGSCEIGGHRFVCHNPEGHGDVSLATALAYSCNIYAYRVGLAAGPEALAAEARRFHFAEPTGIDLPHETQRMLVPDPVWKRDLGRGPWTTGDTVNLCIGQGALRISPLQAACAMASLARRETLTVPTLLHQPGRQPSGGRPAEPLGLADRDYARLIAAMQAVVETGIGRDAQVPGVSIAGKTGTAQVSRPQGMMNVAWFVAFAPADRPEIAVAVALEGDQPGVEFSGAEHAAPVVRDLLGTYFDKRRKPRRGRPRKRPCAARPHGCGACTEGNGVRREARARPPSSAATCGLADSLHTGGRFGLVHHLIPRLSCGFSRILPARR